MDKFKKFCSDHKIEIAAVAIGGTIGLVAWVSYDKGMRSMARSCSDVVISAIAKERKIELTKAKSIEIGNEIAEWIDSGLVKNARMQVLMNK